LNLYANQVSILPAMLKSRHSSGARVRGLCAGVTMNRHHELIV
jgi:hypothetical protein